MEERVELLEQICLELIDALKREQEVSARVIEVQKKMLQLFTEGDDHGHGSTDHD